MNQINKATFNLIDFRARARARARARVCVCVCVCVVKRCFF